MNIHSSHSFQFFPFLPQLSYIIGVFFGVEKVDLPTNLHFSILWPSNKAYAVSALASLLLLTGNLSRERTSLAKTRSLWTRTLQQVEVANLVTVCLCIPGYKGARVNHSHLHRHRWILCGILNKIGIYAVCLFT